MSMAGKTVDERMPVLQVSNLTTSFRTDEGWKPIVKDISFSLKPKETLAIVGESGSGKSVTALSIMRLLDARLSRISGQVKLGQYDLSHFNDRQMRPLRGRELAMIFQEPMTSLNPAFTIGRQIEEALTCHGKMHKAQAREQACALLDKVRIPNARARFHDYPHHFSGGQRQRVMIAMALACRPKLLIADEPTTALDVTIQAQILDLIKILQEEEGTSVLFITHDMGVVAEIADRALVMFQGEAVEQATVDDIFKNSTQPYTRALLAAVPHLGSMRGQNLPRPFPIVDKQTGEITQIPALTQTPSFTNPVLQVDKLCTRYSLRGGFFSREIAAVHAVENVSFSLHKGEILGLVGESGCGKSSIGRTIMRLAQAHSGTITLQGEDLLTAPPHSLRRLRRNVQMIFQDPFASLNPRMRIGKALAEPLIQHGLANKSQARDKAAYLLEQVGLEPDRMQAYPHEFSGGQRQRIAIARALALNPSVILADEPVSALDVSVKAQVCNLLLDLLKKLKLSYLFISHDMAVVERLCHRVAVMYMGEIVEIGPARAIFDNPQHDYTKKLLAAVPVLDPARRHLKRNLADEALKSPIRPVGFVPPTRLFHEISPGHLVMQ